MCTCIRAYTYVYVSYVVIEETNVCIVVLPSPVAIEMLLSWRGFTGVRRGPYGRAARLHIRRLENG